MTDERPSATTEKQMIASIVFRTLLNQPRSGEGARHQADEDGDDPIEEGHAVREACRRVREVAADDAREVAAVHGGQQRADVVEVEVRSDEARDVGADDVERDADGAGHERARKLAQPPASPGRIAHFIWKRTKTLMVRPMRGAAGQGVGAHARQGRLEDRRPYGGLSLGRDRMGEGTINKNGG